MKRTADVSSEFIRFWLKSSLFFDQLDRGNGATVDTLTIQKLQSVELRLPQLVEQKKIATKLDALSEETQRLARLYERKLAALEALKKSLLHQAFAGEL
jgi:type I restriction enzyme S subunit